MPLANPVAHAVSLVSYKRYKALSEETDAFSAKIALNGVIVGSAENGGKGSCNSYGFKSREQRDAFYAEVARWAEATGETSEPEDALIASIAAGVAEQKTATRMAKRGLPLTVAVDVSPCVVEGRTLYMACELASYPQPSLPAVLTQVQNSYPDAPFRVYDATTRLSTAVVEAALNKHLRMSP